MTELISSLQKKIQYDPNAAQRVIIRVNGDLDDGEQKLKARGFEIRRKLKLIKGFAATAPGSSIQSLAAEPWVTHIEEDQQVHTM
jgi:myo-inositol catabolism protein IolC